MLALDREKPATAIPSTKNTSGRMAILNRTPLAMLVPRKLSVATAPPALANTMKRVATPIQFSNWSLKGFSFGLVMLAS